MEKVVIRYLTRGREWFNGDWKDWILDQAEKLPNYRTPTIAVVADVRLKTLYDGIVLFILGLAVSGLIWSGQIVGFDEGAVYVKINTRGWATDNNLKNPKIYDNFDLLYPQVEDGAIFIITSYQQSPTQARYGVSDKDSSRCIGTDIETESCKINQDCINPYTKHGIISRQECIYEDNGEINPENAEYGYCMIDGWCNQYIYYCVTNKIAYGTNMNCQSNCPACYNKTISSVNICDNNDIPFIDNKNSLYDSSFDDKPYICIQNSNNEIRKCFNDNYSGNLEINRCEGVYKTTNSLLTTETGLLLIEGINDWKIRFDITMKFPRFFQTRNMVNEYFNDTNIWYLDEILRKVNTNYDSIKENGILIQATGLFECSIFSRYCNKNWEFTRLDENNQGFELTYKLYVPGVSIFLEALKSRESRYIFNVKGIRMLVSVSSKMYAPDPIAALTAIGSIMGLLSMSHTITQLVMKKFHPKSKKYSQYLEVDYETWVEQEKTSIADAFYISIQKHMQALYNKEQKLKNLMGDEPKLKGKKF